MAISDPDLRLALDARGLLRDGAVAAPDPSDGFFVFGQPTHVAIPLSSLEANAARFFSTKLGLTVEKHYRADDVLAADAAHVVVANDGVQAVRLLYVRRLTEDDFDRADRASIQDGGSGMADLARRCKTAWIVASDGDDDRAALTLAAVLASVVLGPIIPPSGAALFGVRTARAMLEQRVSPYRG